MPDFYDPTYDQFPELRLGRIVLAPVRVGVDRRTGKIKIGWAHVVQSIEVIFITRFHERVLRRWVGSFVPHLLGENAIERVITRFYWAVAGAIDIWEPNYSILRVRVTRRTETGGEEDILSSVEELRRGELTTHNDGVYRPRGHLGDPTPENRRVLGLIGAGMSRWHAIP